MDWYTVKGHRHMDSGC